MDCSWQAEIVKVFDRRQCYISMFQAMLKVCPLKSFFKAQPDLVTQSISLWPENFSHNCTSTVKNREYFHRQIPVSRNPHSATNAAAQCHHSNQLCCGTQQARVTFNYTTALPLHGNQQTNKLHTCSCIFMSSCKQELFSDLTLYSCWSQSLHFCMLSKLPR